MWLALGLSWCRSAGWAFGEGAGLLGLLPGCWFFVGWLSWCGFWSGSWRVCGVVGFRGAILACFGLCVVWWWLGVWRVF